MVAASCMAAWLPVLGALLPPRQAPPEVRLQEWVDVARVVVDVRVLDGLARPLRGLTVGDFVVRVKGRPVALESVRWEGAEPAEPLDGGSPGVRAVPAGGLAVFLFQKDLHASRVPGLFRMQAGAVDLLETLRPEDRVAVASFDSHLKLWCDFTADRVALRRVIRHSILFESEPGPLVPTGPRSLLPHYDLAAARDAATPEEALLVLARALLGVPGSKSLAFFGWGLGRLAGPRVVMENDYPAAVQALLDSRTAVFALDVTDADFHTLEVGLERVAADTGGFYAKTHVFAGQALASLEGALAGHYSLAFESRGLPPGRHALEVRLVGRKGSVVARPFVVIDAPPSFAPP